MSNTREKIRKPNKKAKETGDEIVKLASWGMISRLEIGADLDRLKFIIGILVCAIVAATILAYQFLIPYTAELGWLVGLSVTLAGVAISVWSIFKGIERILVEERYQRKVVMYPSSYKFDGKDVLVTAINIGDPLVVRGVDLVVGWVEANRFGSVVAGKGFLHFTDLGHVPLFAGCMPMNTGSIWRIREDDVKEGLLHIASWFKETLQNHKEIWTEESPEVYLVMWDRFLEYHKKEEEKRRGSSLIKPIHGLISMCHLEDFNLLLTQAQSEEGIKMHEIAIESKGNSEKAPVPGMITQYAPPLFPSEQEYMAEYLQTLQKISEKLDAIQKSQDEKNKKLKPDKGR
jgi:hypothetical protein